jgi:hypothetical protein
MIECSEMKLTRWTIFYQFLVLDRYWPANSCILYLNLHGLPYVLFYIEGTICEYQVPWWLSNIDYFTERFVL